VEGGGAIRPDHHARVQDLEERQSGDDEYRLQGLFVFRMKILVSAVTFRRQFRAELEDTT